MGDELMAAGAASRLRWADPQQRRVVILDRKGVHRWHSLWHRVPDIVRPLEREHFRDADLQFMTDGPSARPYVDYDRMRAEFAKKYPGEAYTTKRKSIPWRFKPYKPTAPDLGIHRMKGQYLVVEPNLKPGNTMPGKEWGWDNWQALVTSLRILNLPWVQLGPKGTRLLRGVRHIETADFWAAMEALRHARACVLPEGGLHHAAASIGVPAVVIYGGVVTPTATGYDLHHNITSGGAESPCGMRQTCQHCVNAMRAITPDQIIEHLMEIMKDD